MPITVEEMNAATAPFKVELDGKRRVPIIVEGFSENDPLGVGGGIFPDMPAAYLKSGGWLLVKDLMCHYSIVQ